MTPTSKYIRYMADGWLLLLAVFAELPQSRSESGCGRV
jgi:hypothetical protein